VARTEVEVAVQINNKDRSPEKRQRERPRFPGSTCQSARKKYSPKEMFRDEKYNTAKQGLIF
jgi:hypothetical protein